MSFPRYPTYKDSGELSLGLIPSHWRVVRVGDVVKLINGYPFDARLFDEAGAYPLIRIRDLDAAEAATKYSGDFVETAAVTSADVLVGMDGDFNVGRWRGDTPALLNQRMCCLRGSNPDLVRLLELALPQPLNVINDLTYATTVKHLSSFQIEKIRLALPTTEQELRDVVRFLDHEIAKIDALVAEQEQLITLLKEKRQAVISHAVTKGLDASVPMRDSGVEWLGEVPAHWEVGSLKRYWSVTDCKHVTAEFVEEGIPLASIREVQGRWVNLEEAKCTTEYFYELLIDGDRKPRPGDLIFSRNATVGEVAQVDEKHPRFAMGQDVVLLRKLSSSYSSDFLQFVIRSPVVIRQLANLMIGSTFKRINVEEIRSFLLIFPPPQEQMEIATFLNAEVELFDSLTAEVQRTIALLQERRSALISAVVTGQIDVRGLATEKEIV